MSCRSAPPVNLNARSFGSFARTKAAARAEINEIAQELVVLYQKRVHTPGHAFPMDTPWQRELEEAFPFQETPDQLQAIVDVKADMEGIRGPLNDMKARCGAGLPGEGGPGPR